MSTRSIDCSIVRRCNRDCAAASIQRLAEPIYCHPRALEMPPRAPRPHGESHRHRTSPGPRGQDRDGRPEIGGALRLQKGVRGFDPLSLTIRSPHDTSPKHRTPDAAVDLTPVVSQLPSRIWTGPATSRSPSGATWPQRSHAGPTLRMTRSPSPAMCAHFTSVIRGFPFSTTYVASSAPFPPPTFFTEWIAPAGTNKTSPALTRRVGRPSILYSSAPSMT